MSHTKSDRIRAAARSLTEQGRPPRPKEIVEILAKEGVRVLSSQVSTALRGTDLALTKGMDHWRPNPQPAPPKLKPPDPSSALEQATLQELNKAEEFVRSIGDEKKAMVALVALGQLKREPNREPTQEPQYYGGA